MVQFEDFKNLGMGANIIQRIYSSNAKNITTLSKNELKKLEILMSFYITSSKVSRLNSETGQAEVLLSKKTFEVVKKVRKLQYKGKTLKPISLTSENKKQYM